MWSLSRVLLLLMMSLNAFGISTIHVGITTNYRGGKKVQYMEYAEAVFRDELEAQNNQLGGVARNLIFHHADGLSDKTRIADIGPGLVQGTWVDDYWSTQPDEPAPAPCAIIICNYDSGSLKALLNGLEAANLKVPVYSSGSSAGSIWNVNVDGTAKYDNIKTAHLPGTHQLHSIFKRLYELGARTLVIVREVEFKDGWTSGAYQAAKAYAIELGFTIVVEGHVVYERCSETDDPVACEDLFNAGMDQMVVDGGLKKHQKKIQADVYWGMKHHSYGCEEEAKYMKENELNFGAMITHMCYGKEAPKGHDKTIYAYTYSGLGWHASVETDATDETQYALANYPKFFPNAGKASGQAFVALYEEKFGADQLYYYHYPWCLSAFYLFWRDWVEANGSPSAMLDIFNKRSTPIVSLYGYLAPTVGGSNAYHKYLGGQYLPKEQKGVIVAPKAFAVKEPVYPMPMWHERDCFPSCSPCPKCDELEAMTPLIYSAIGSASVLVVSYGAIERYRKPEMDFLYFMCYVGGGAGFIFNTVTDAFSIINVYLQGNAGMIDFDKVGIAFNLYIIFVAFGVVLTLLRVRIYSALCTAIIYTSDKKLMACKIVDEMSVLVSACFVDIPIFAVQVAIALQPQGATRLLVIGMLATAFSLGFATQAFEKYNLLTSEVKNLGSNRDSRRSLPNANRLHDFLRAFNPCHSLGGSVHKIVPVNGYDATGDNYQSREQSVDGDDKSI